MPYINDPRELAIRPESGVTLEEDNRVETMYHWGARVLDLCDMPVSEYMKPPTLITYSEYNLIFKNGNEIISQKKVKEGDIINYPILENKIEGDIEYEFVWNDISYNGAPMPNHDLIISGEYKNVIQPLIYFGTFKVKKSEYNSGNTSQYFNEAKLETEYFDSLTIKECIGEGAVAKVPCIRDEEYANLSVVERNKYKKENKCPYCFLLPSDLDKNYIISISDFIVDHWPEFITDGKIINYKGNEYKFWVYYTDAAIPVINTETSDLTIKLFKITKK